MGGRWRGGERVAVLGEAAMMSGCLIAEMELDSEPAPAQAETKVE